MKYPIVITETGSRIKKKENKIRYFFLSLTYKNNIRYFINFYIDRLF